MKQSPLRLTINLVVSAVILATGIACFQLCGAKPEIEKETDEFGDRVTLVQTVTVAAYSEPLWLNTNGEAATFRVLTLGAEVAGQVVNKPEGTRSGDFVQEGTLLFEIDSLNYRLEVERLQAELDRINAEVEAISVNLQNIKPLLQLAQEDLELQRRQLIRAQNLYERKATTESDLEASMRLELTARNSLQALVNQESTLVQQRLTKLAERELSEAQMSRALADVERCQVRSKIAGRLVDDLVEQGDYVRVGDPLVHISDASQMEIRCNLEAEDLGWVWQQELSRKGATSEDTAAVLDPIKLQPVPCEVVYQFDGLETIWDGEITRFEGSGMDRETRTFPCRIRVSEPQKTRVKNRGGGTIGVAPPTLLSGMYVAIRIPITTAKALLSLPQEAIRPGGRVWLARDDQLVIEEVNVVRMLGEVALVSGESSKLQPGDQVIVSPLSSAVNGMPIKVEAEEFPAGKGEDESKGNSGGAATPPVGQAVGGSSGGVQ